MFQFLSRLKSGASLKHLCEYVLGYFDDIDKLSKIDWSTISRCPRLSENFMRQFQDKLEWLFISVNQELSESFIEEFQD